MRGLLAATLAALVAALFAPAAFASAPATSTGPTYDGKGHLVQTPFVPAGPHRSLTQKQALKVFESDPKVSAWLSRASSTLPQPSTSCAASRRASSPVGPNGKPGARVNRGSVP